MSIDEYGEEEVYKSRIPLLVSVLSVLQMLLCVGWCCLYKKHRDLQRRARAEEAQERQSAPNSECSEPIFITGRGGIQSELGSTPGIKLQSYTELVHGISSSQVQPILRPTTLNSQVVQKLGLGLSNIGSSTMSNSPHGIGRAGSLPTPISDTSPSSMHSLTVKVTNASRTSKPGRKN